MNSYTLDTRGLMCPEPVIRSEKYIRDLPPGSELRILATDPAAEIDFEFWCLQRGYDYQSCEETGEWLEIRVGKKPA